MVAYGINIYLILVFCLEMAVLANLKRLRMADAMFLYDTRSIIVFPGDGLIKKGLYVACAGHVDCAHEV